MSNVHDNRDAWERGPHDPECGCDTCWAIRQTPDDDPGPDEGNDPDGDSDEDSTDD